MLQPDRNRASFGRRGWAAAALAALAVGIPLAAAGVAPADEAVVITPPTSEATQADVSPPSPPPLSARDGAPLTTAARQATVVGSVLDPSGGTVPGAEVTLTAAETGVRAVAQTDAAGRFAFRNLQPARYELVVRFAGFTTVTSALRLAPGAAVDQEITLPLGTVQETITISCPGTQALRQLVARTIDAAFPVLLAQEPAPGAPIRVGGNIRAPKKLTDAKPVCPANVPATETTVRLTGRIGVDGLMIDVRPVPAADGVEPPAELTESAIDAVRQWTYSPTLLNDRPVEVDNSVRVVFQRR